MADLGASGFSQFDRLATLVRRTRALLDAVAAEGELPDGGADYLADAAIPHLEGVQDGFRGWLRADSATRAELRYLIGQLGTVRALEESRPRQTLLGATVPDPDREAALAEAAVEARLEARLGARARELRAPETWHLAALAHARLVLAFLPRVPDDAVRFPVGRRTYADIPAPRGPVELAARIEELERELWLTAVGHPRPRTDPAFRRTYGFFDAAERFDGPAPG